MTSLVVAPLAGVVAFAASAISESTKIRRLRTGLRAWLTGHGATLDVGDYDGDGNPELLVGAPNEDSGGSTAGTAYLVYD